MLLRGTERVALMPGRLAARLREAADIRILPPPMPLMDTTFAMAWPSLHARDEGHAWFRTMIVEVAAELREDGSLACAM
jgi:DNA-binding transcriptional LysR family regulator